MENLTRRVHDILSSASNVVFLTGAGLSAESGIPTFRGEEGYWTIGSENYFPEELATNRAFHQHSLDIWQWYQHRKRKCAEAAPNPGHYAIANFHKQWKEAGSQFTLVTQNVDNLNPQALTQHFAPKPVPPAYFDDLIEVHGNIFRERCSNYSCTEFKNPQYSASANYNTIDDIPTCKKCQALIRPHVLWFDEVYDEELFQARTALLKTYDADVLFVIGTSLQTTIPYQMVSIAYNRNIPIVEINLTPLLSRYSDLVFETSAAAVLPVLLKNS